MYRLVLCLAILAALVAPIVLAPPDVSAGKGWARQCAGAMCVAPRAVGDGSVAPGSAEPRPRYAVDGESRYVCYKAYRNGTRYGTYIDHYIFDAWPSPHWRWVGSTTTRSLSPTFCSWWGSVNVAV